MKLGGNVARMQLAGEKTHFATPGASQPLYLPWIADRLAGKPAPDGCAAIGPRLAAEIAAFLAQPG